MTSPEPSQTVHVAVVRLVDPIIGGDEIGGASSRARRSCSNSSASTRGCAPRAFGTASAFDSVVEGDALGFGMDVAGAIPGVGGAVRGARAARALKAANAEEAVRRAVTAHPWVGKEVSQLWKVQTDAAIANAKSMKKVAKTLDQSSVAISIVSAIRNETKPGPSNPLHYRDEHVPRRLRPVRLTTAHP